MTVPTAREVTAKFSRRFWSKVDRRGPDECWPWLAGTISGGYGRFAVGSRSNGTKRTVKAHRIAYVLLVGPIPEELEPDHLCRNHGCVNPAHIEWVTHRENILRGETIPARNAAKTHCKRGHPFDSENTYMYPRGKRRCRICHKESERERRSAT